MPKTTFILIEMPPEYKVKKDEIQSKIEWDFPGAQVLQIVKGDEGDEPVIYFP